MFGRIMFCILVSGFPGRGEPPDRTVRVNMSLPERLLRRIDERARNHSAFLARAAEKALRCPNCCAARHGIAPATAAHARGSRTEFAADLPLEGSGFEPSVPLPRLSSIRAVRAEIIGRSTDVFRRDREFDVSALQGRLSTSYQSQCSTDPGLIAGTWHRPLFLTRDRWFESGSLHRRVRSELLP